MDIERKSPIALPYSIVDWRFRGAPLLDTMTFRVNYRRGFSIRPSAVLKVNLGNKGVIVRSKR